MSPTDPQPRLPHHKLVPYQLALELVQLIAHTRIADAHLRQQARKSASSCALTAFLSTNEDQIRGLRFRSSA